MFEVVLLEINLVGMYLDFVSFLGLMLHLVLYLLETIVGFEENGLTLYVASLSLHKMGGNHA